MTTKLIEYHFDCMKNNYSNDATQLTISLDVNKDDIKYKRDEATLKLTTKTTAVKQVVPAARNVVRFPEFISEFDSV